ncbi:MAG: NADH dehydrogenase (quinone) subunit D [Deltaproteobacteria bacterium]|nr:NADH dehydrogenase (quinone) subunit D [Deltaproteobacteria bacterium]
MSDVSFESGDGELMKVNMGPQHPSTHGVLRLELELDGEIVRSCNPVIGYLHTGMEKTIEQLTYVQAVTITDRMDYLNPLGNNLAYSLSVEQLFGCEIPERAQVGRVLLAELTRINSHLVSIGSGSIDLGVTSVFLYCLREREKVLALFEELTGQRMMSSYIRPGGLAWDMDETWCKHARAFVDEMPRHIDEYEGIVTDNPFFRERTIGIGPLKADDAIRLGVSGPLLRAAGVPHDLRKVHPYTGYERFEFKVVTDDAGDCYGRYKVRVGELRESVKICDQALKLLERVTGPVKTADRKVMPPPKSELATSMESLIHHFKLFTEGMRPPAGQAYCPVESPRGELGYLVVSDGSGKPARVRARTPSFANLQAIELMSKGQLVADLVAIIASIDPVMGDVDR